MSKFYLQCFWLLCFFQSSALLALDCTKMTDDPEYFNTHEAQCYNSPEFNYHYGLLALKSNKPSLAISFFERVTVLDKNHAGVWIDMAEAYYRQDNRQGVHYALGELTKKFNIPSQLKPVIKFYRVWYDETKHTSRTSGGVFVGSGFSDNINSGSSSRSIDLQFGDQILGVELGEDSRAIKDDFLDVGGFWQYSSLDNNLSGKRDDMLDSYIRFSFNNREYGSHHKYSSGVLMLSAGSEYTKGKERLVFNSAFAAYIQSGDFYQRNYLLSALYGQQIKENLQVKMRLGYEKSSYVDTTSDLNRYSFMLEGDYRTRAGVWSATWRKGSDIVSGVRAGGDTRWYSGGLAWKYHFRSSILSASVYHRVEDDSEVYSSSLLGDRKKDKEILGIDVSYHKILTRQLSAEFTVTSTKTQSEIELFDGSQNKIGVTAYYYW